MEVNVHDFPNKTLGKAIPDGIYDLAQNQGWVSVGIDHDTVEFAVESIRLWWLGMGQPLYPRSKYLLITADCSGSNGYRNRLWKLKLQEFADQMGLTIHVCIFHLEPANGTRLSIDCSAILPRTGGVDH